MRVHFQKIDVEQEFDTVSIEDGDGNTVEHYDGTHDNKYSDYIEGDKMVVKLVSDNEIQWYGFVVDKYEFID